MSFEAEVIPLFIGGVIAVSAIEFFLGWRSLRHRKDLRGLFAGHVVAMLLGFFFLIRSLFANWPVSIPISLHALIILTAISPRFAINIFCIMKSPLIL